jgi:formate hydrogenlyase subunit 3/multisubunit Na+/H+ antiporter MnhD subunit
MSAPFLWIFLPLMLAGLLLLFRNQKVVVLVSCAFTFFLTLAACLFPIDTALAIGNWSFKLTSSFEILGRYLILSTANRSYLALIYGSSFFWFGATFSSGASRRLIPFGLAITALLVAALAVEPFLYAALLIEMAVLLSVPLLSTSGQKPGRGIIRFLIFQTLAMPFILFSGWLLAGIEANPGDLGLVQQAAILISLGFSFLLAVFPFYSWIPLLTEEASPFEVGFILWMFPTVTIFFGLGFLDRYTWLRDASSLGMILTTVGILMIFSGGLLAAFQRHLGRILGYAVIMETGYSLLAINLGEKSGLGIFFFLFIPRVLALVLWAFSLTILKEHYPSLVLDNMKGLLHKWPFATSGLILANLALVGMPLLATFPSHIAIWAGLASRSLPAVIWVLLGNLGIFISVLRAVYNFAIVHDETPWGSRETILQRVLLVIGILAIFLLGLFPQWAYPIWTRLPALFIHLGQ